MLESGEGRDDGDLVIPGRDSGDLNGNIALYCSTEHWPPEVCRTLLQGEDPILIEVAGGAGDVGVGAGGQEVLLPASSAIPSVVEAFRLCQTFKSPSLRG